MVIPRVFTLKESNITQAITGMVLQLEFIPKSEIMEMMENSWQYQMEVHGSGSLFPISESVD
jgi:hypothetical protein